MNPNEALEEVLKDLTSSFGDGLAARIVMSARSSVQTPDAGFDRETYAEVVHTLSKDARVVGMLGELGVREKCSRWERLVD